MRVFGILLMILGSLGAVTEGCTIGSGRAEDPVFGIVLSVSLVLAGHAALAYSRKCYRGGTTSIVGGVLLWIGVVRFTGEVEEYFLGEVVSLWPVVFALLVFSGLGGALLIAGHRIHKERGLSSKRVANVDDGTEQDEQLSEGPEGTRNR